MFSVLMAILGDIFVMSSLNPAEMTRLRADERVEAPPCDLSAVMIQ
jgi:hypothetical protein